MKYLHIILSIVLSLLALESTHAQKKIGVFIHGFQGSSEKWTEISKVPENWEGKIIDDYVALNYETPELKYDYTRQKMLERFITRMDKVGCEVNGLDCSRSDVSYNRKNGDQWILIGHSLGGIVARRLYPALRGAGFNIEAIVSVGGPLQGAPATDVDPKDVRKTIADMRGVFTEAYKYRRTYIDLGVLVKDLLEGTNQRARIDAIPDYIKIAKDSAFGYANLVVDKKANELIGRDGKEIEEINKYSSNDLANHPPNYLSIIGAEKDKAPIRMAGQIFEGKEELKDEDDMIKGISDLRNEYVQRHVNYYHRLVDKYYLVYYSCRSFNPFNAGACSGAYADVKHAKKRRGVWKNVRGEIDDLGKTWSEIINSTRRVNHTIRTFIPPCSDGGGRFPGQFNIQYIEDDCSQNPEGEYRYVTYEQHIADKNDGVVNVHNALWSKNDSFDDQNNIYMKDVHLNTDGLDQGGYNHFELRNYYRQYELKQNNTVVFKSTDPNPAMEDVEEWIRVRFGNSSN